MRSHDRVPALVLAGILAAPALAGAERLPIRAYTTDDGLAHNVVNRIVRDSRGFLWFATNDGLSRFDGYGFTNFSVEQGLPHRKVMDLVETRDGQFWVATDGGLAWFRPRGTPGPHVVSINDAAQPPPMFAAIAPDDNDPRARRFNVVIQTSDGAIWCGGRKGLFRLDRSHGRFSLVAVDLGMPTDIQEGRYVNDLLEDRTGSVWAAATTGLYRRWVDGRTARYTADEGLPDVFLHELMLDHHDRIWIASRQGGFFRIAATGDRAAPSVVERYGPAQGLPVGWISSLLETSDGRFWAATPLGIIELLPEESEHRFRGYDQRNGLGYAEVSALGEDAGGNLWVATDNAGVMRVARSGFVTYGEADGLHWVADLFEDARGSLYVKGQMSVDLPGGRQRAPANELRWNPATVARFEAGRFRRLVPRGLWLGWVNEKAILQTRNHEWWIATGLGLARFPPTRAWNRVRATRPLRIYTDDDGLAFPPQVFRMFEDSRSNIWISTVGYGWHGLARWDRATETLHPVGDDTPGLPDVKTELTRAFGEDRDGNVWIGFNTGVARYQDGRFVFFAAGDVLPAGEIVVIHRDRRGRLWLGSAQGGLIRVDNPSADRPAFTRYTTDNGLSANSVTTMTDGPDGYLYVATGRGIDRLDPATGQVRHFGTSDGLASGTVLVAYCDRTGTVWFGTIGGLSRLDPAPEFRRQRPRVLVTGLVVAGTSEIVSAVGETNVVLPNLRHNANQVDISFVALGPDSGDSLRYQYRLEGAPADWGPLTTRRSVSYASLSPGRYRFLVRAVAADGLVSPVPAVVAFTVLPPFWRTWWFLLLTVAAAAASGLAVHRYRLFRLLELERMRTRIATDLHDDVGANLTRIAILSEVVERSSNGADRQKDAIASIGSIARESVSAMNDIVWALNPDRDTLKAMVNRMRHYAEEVFEGRDVALVFDLADLEETTTLDLDVRRDLYLIFKEAVNNAARHSRCKRAWIAFRVTRTRLLLEVADDGVGFDSTTESDGAGLASMRRRADRIGATLEIGSNGEGGTRVSLSAPFGSVGASL